MYNHADMEDNLAWKLVYAAVIFSLLVLALAYQLISAREAKFKGANTVGDNVAEFSDIKLAGRKEGKPGWSFKVKDGYVSKNREFTFLNEVSEGTVFKDGQPVIKNLLAPQMRVFRDSDILEAVGAGDRQLSARINLGRLSRESRDKWADLISDSLVMRPKEKQSEISGRITIRQKRSVLRAAAARLNHENKTADLAGGVSLLDNDIFLESEEMRFLGEDEKLEAAGKVRLRIEEGRTITRVKAGRADFYTDEKKEVSFWGDIEVVQGRNLAEAASGKFDRQKDELALEGNVRAVFQKAGDAIDDKLATEVRNPEARMILKEKTFLTSDRFIFATRTGDARAFGAVHVSQKGREAKADQAVYTDDDDVIVMTGNVSLKKDDKWVRANRVTISVEKETFGASGSVEAEFKI